MFRPPQLPRTLEAALRDATSSKQAVRVEAIRDLVPYGAAGATDDSASEVRADVLRVVEAALRDGAPQVRSAAAVALADLGATQALPALLVAVEDDDAHVRQMAITALGEIGDARATERLRRALSDRRPEVRFQAVIAFPRVCASRADAMAALLDATKDDDPLVVQIALRMAEEIGVGGKDDAGAATSRREDDPVLARARELVEDGPPVVRAAAAVLLARTGDRSGQGVLVAVANGALAGVDGEDEAAAIELVGELGLSEATAGLEGRAFGAALSLRRDRFAWHARVALARMGHARAARDIVAELGAWSRDKRTLAVAAVGRARLTDARPIVAAMRGDPNRAEPETVEETLALLDGGRAATA